ncbi:fibronectin type III domain-containing protein [Candidatus Woesearchaeota archaeon]|nr:fibronectin type III domain-containing protein [Candidatus Woesearchaeota archaeon]
MSRTEASAVLRLACIYGVIGLIITLPVASVTILNIDVIALEQGATIEWQTDALANSTVNYGITSAMSSHTGSQDMVTSHSVDISSLVANTDYSYQVQSCAGPGDCDISGILQFSTLAEGTTSSDTLFMELGGQLGNSTNNSVYTIYGRTESDAVVRFYINGNPDQGAGPVLVTATDNTEAFYLGAGPDGQFIGDLHLFPGTNNILAVARKGIEEGRANITVMLDSIRPSALLADVPAGSKEGTMSLSGSVTEPGTVEILVDGSVQDSMETENQFVFNNVQLGNVGQGEEKTVRIQLRVTDRAGNVGMSPEYSIKVDRKIPTIVHETDYHPLMHSILLNVKGKTEPGAIVHVQNLRNLSNVQEYTDRMARNDLTFIDPVDPLGEWFKEKTTTADEHGDFSVYLNLYRGRNHIYFNAADAAGNSYVDYQDATVELATTKWRIARVDTYPSSLYFEDIANGEVEATAFLVLDWVGGDPRPAKAELKVVEKDGPNTDNNDLIGRPSRLKGGGYYDKDNGRLFALVGIKVNRWAGTSDALFDKLYGNCVGDLCLPDLKIHGEIVQKQMIISIKGEVVETFVSPTGEQAVTPSIIYEKFGYAVQKPNDLSKWLSPQLINDSIQFLTKTEEFLDKAQDLLVKLTGIGLLACGVAVFSNLIGGFIISPSREQMYWVCDRVLCPSIPPDCGSISDRNAVYSGGASSGPLETVTLKDAENRYTKHRFVQVTETNKNSYPCSPGQYAMLSSSGESTQLKSGVIGERVTEKEFTSYCFSQDDYQKLTLDDAFFTNFNAGRCYQENEPYYDNTRCFGQKFDDWTSPRDDIIKSMQCGCITGIYGYTRSLLTVVRGMKQCLQQAQIGEVKGGFCERLFLQFACDQAANLFTKILPQEFTGEYQQEVPDDDYHGTNPGGYVQTARNLQASLKDRYGGVIDSAKGLSSEKLVNNFCLAATLGDISILEGAIETFAAASPVAPWGMVKGSSRQAGYDPFVGQMKINYNIYVGVVPGGDNTEMEVKLVCDRSYEGGEFCPATREETVLSNVPRSLNKNDFYNQNVIFQSAPARHWYNKVVLTLKYRLATDEPWETRSYDSVISRQSDLAYGCEYSLTGGIACEPITIDENGILQIVKSSTETRDNEYTDISPDNGIFYYPDNKIGLRTRIFNDYNEDFFLRMIITPPGTAATPAAYEFKIPATTNEAGEAQNYNLFIARMGQQTSQSAFIGGPMPLPNINSNKVYLTTTSATPGSVAVQVGDATGIKNCEPLNQGAGALIAVNTLLTALQPRIDSGELSTKDYEPTGTSNAMKLMIDHGTGYVYEIKQGKVDRLLAVRNSQDKNLIDDMWRIFNYVPASSAFSECTFERTISKITGMAQEPTAVDIWVDESGTKKWKERLWISNQNTQNIPQGMYKVKLNVYKDTNSDGQGDTEIPYDAASQEFEVTFRGENTQSGCTRMPSIDVLEPVGNYMPRSVPAEGILVGANIVDDCNKISTMRIALVKKSNRNNEICATQYAAADNDAYGYIGLSPTITTGNCDFELVSAPTLNELAPPYYQFKFTNSASAPAFANEDHEIIFRVTDQLGQAGEKAKTIAFTDNIDPLILKLRPSPARTPYSILGTPPG